MNDLIPIDDLFSFPSAQTRPAPSAEVIWLADFNSPNTRNGYGAAVKEFNSVLGIQTPEQLRAATTAEIISYKRWLETEGKSPRTINNRLSALSSLFDHLQDKQLITVNPAQGIKRLRIKQDKTVSDSLTPSQVQKILQKPDTGTLKGLRDYTILMTLFYTGCRATEVCTLDVKDYRTDRGFHVLVFTFFIHEDLATPFALK